MTRGSLKRLSVLTIRDSSGEFLSFDLRDILDVIATWGTELTWVLREVSGSGPAFEPHSSETSETFPELTLTWVDLVEFSQRVGQIYDGMFSGMRDPASLAGIDGSEFPWKNAEISLEAVDSSYWRVFARESEIFAALSARFRDTELRPLLE